MADSPAAPPEGERPTAMVPPPSDDSWIVMDVLETGERWTPREQAEKAIQILDGTPDAVRRQLAYRTLASDPCADYCTFEVVDGALKCSGCGDSFDIETACEVMHDAYEQAAVGSGWETNPASRKSWADVPESNKATMRAAVRALLEWVANR